MDDCHCQARRLQVANASALARSVGQLTSHWAIAIIARVIQVVCDDDERVLTSLSVSPLSPPRAVLDEIERTGELVADEPFDCTLDDGDFIQAYVVAEFSVALPPVGPST